MWKGKKNYSCCFNFANSASSLARALRSSFGSKYFAIFYRVKFRTVKIQNNFKFRNQLLTSLWALPFSYSVIQLFISWGKETCVIPALSDICNAALNITDAPSF